MTYNLPRIGGPCGTRVIERAHARMRRPTAPDFTRHGPSGGGKTTVVNQVPAKTPEEIELIGKQNQILDIQIGELRRQNEALTAIFPDQQKLLAAQTQAAITFAETQKQDLEITRRFLAEQEPLVREQMTLQRQLTERALKEIEGTPEEQEIRKLSNQRALAVLKGEAPPLSAGQRERIDTIFKAAREEGATELTRFGEDLATSRGLRVSDSPIGNELVRQKRMLEQNLLAGKASAELSVGQAQQSFDEAVRQFQENLRQQGFQNRLALTGRASPFAAPGGGGGGMVPVFAGTTSNAALAGAGNLLNTLGAERLGSASQTSRTVGTGGFNFAGAAVGGVGGAASGALAGSQLGSLLGPYGTAIGAVAGGLLGAFGGGFGRSSGRFKTDIRPLDKDEYDAALEKVRATPIVRYRYRWERGDERAPHIGPILELSPEEIREDASRVNLLDYTGLVHAAVKAVDRRLERVEAALPVERKGGKKPGALPVRRAA